MYCHKHLSRNEMAYQAIFNKMSSDSIPDEIKDLNKFKKILISKRIAFKKIAIMHRNEEFAKLKGSICNISIETASICNILPRPTDLKGLIVVKLKRDLQYTGYVYFEQAHPNVIYWH